MYFWYFSLVDLSTVPRKLHKNNSRHLNLSKNLRFVKINRARRERMFYITTSSPSFFVYCTCCTADALQSVCIGKHNHSYRQNSKGKKIACPSITHFTLTADVVARSLANLQLHCFSSFHFREANE